MSIKLCRQSFPIMLLISAVSGEQLRATAQSDTAASPSREFFGTRQHMTSEQVGCNSDTFLTGMHLAWFCADFAHLKQSLLIVSDCAVAHSSVPH